MDQQGVSLNPLDIWNNFQKLISGKLSINPKEIVHWTIVSAIFFYLLFAFMIVRQVGLMTRFLGTNLSPWIKTFAWGYFFYTALVLLVILGIF